MRRGPRNTAGEQGDPRMGLGSGINEASWVGTWRGTRGRGMSKRTSEGLGPWDEREDPPQIDQ